jgi:hypothetical protein
MFKKIAGRTPCLLCFILTDHKKMKYYLNLRLFSATPASSVCLPIHLSIYLSIYIWLYSPLLDPGSFFSFLILYTAGRTSWTGDQPVARPLPTRRIIQTQNKCRQISMPRVGFEPTIPVFERAMTDHALDHAATVIGYRKA